MNKTLQIEIDPFLCASQGRMFDGQLGYQDMQRLQADVDPAMPDINIHMEFARKGKFIVLTGRIHGYLVLQCAACLGAIDFPIDIDLKLAVVNDEALLSLIPSGFEPHLFDGDKLLLSSIVEDELVLALPDIARHEVCSIELPRVSTSKDFVEEVDVKENPFKVLEGFKNN
ncbi:MAG: nucleic acid-binding protein [Piscirickettsiaceae bacterium]|nr:MAG: nucleic acid-binding protein [Piscirickettsiaceae bacterium]